MTQPSPDGWRPPPQQWRGGPHQQPPHPGLEYQRRAAAAAESTSRKVSLLVWLLVGVPVLIGLVVGAAFLIGALASSSATKSTEEAYAKVEAVYQQVGYPPTPATVRNQAAGICENLQTGMPQAEAARRMVQGFGPPLTMDKAGPIVAAVAANICGR